jgi:hypothetical protein
VLRGSVQEAVIVTCSMVIGVSNQQMRPE